MIKYKKINLTILQIVICSFCLYSQHDSIVRYERGDSLVCLKYNCNHMYTSLEEAIRDSLKVKCLDLRSKGYAEFPSQVLKLQNVEYVDLSAVDSSDLYSEYVRREKEQELIIKEHPGIHDFVSYIKGDYNRNKIEKIPKEIKSLQNLKWLDVTSTDLSKNQVKKLRRILPKCKVISSYDEM